MKAAWSFLLHVTTATCLMLPTVAMAVVQGYIIDGKPCAGADLLVTHGGRRYELLPKQTDGISGPVDLSGKVYPKASICKVYPFFQVLHIKKAGPATAAPKRARADDATGAQLRAARKFFVFTQMPGNSVKALREAVALQKEFPASHVTLYIVGGTIENMAKLALLMRQDHLTFRSGFRITAAPKGSPSEGIDVIWQQSHRYFHSFDALDRYANLD